MSSVVAVGVSAAVGLCAGSFATTLASRSMRDISIRLPAHCPSCEGLIGWRDRIPLVSWVRLRGRCRRCDALIGWRYPLLELLCAVFFVLVVHRMGVTLALPAYLYLVVIGLALATVDVAVQRLPDVLTLPSYGVLGVLLGVAAVFEGDLGLFWRVAACGAMLFGAYFLLAFCVPSAMGFGDVKLAGVLGMALGWLGWSAPWGATIVAFLVGGVVSLVLLVSRRIGGKSRIPFGPFMLVGAFLVFLV